MIIPLPQGILQRIGAAIVSGLNCGAVRQQISHAAVHEDEREDEHSD
jgi:hypothetical protein